MLLPPTPFGSYRLCTIQCLCPTFQHFSSNKMEACQAGTRLNVKIWVKVILPFLNFAKIGPVKAQAAFGKLLKSGVFLYVPFAQ